MTTRATALGLENTCRVFKPRPPRESPPFRLVEQHLGELLRVWPTASSGSLVTPS
jgi:hypothetical protein